MQLIFFMPLNKSKSSYRHQIYAHTLFVRFFLLLFRIEMQKPLRVLHNWVRVAIVCIQLQWEKREKDMLIFCS